MQRRGQIVWHLLWVVSVVSPVRPFNSVLILSHNRLVLRRQAFDVISLETFTSLGTQTRDLTELRVTLNKVNAMNLYS